MRIVYYALWMLLRPIPSIRKINHLRGFFLKRLTHSCSTNLRVGSSVRITSPHNIKIGDNVAINAEVHLVASHQGIYIGNNVLIAPRCYLQTQNHLYIQRNILIKDQGTEEKPICIHDDVWLGYGVIVLPGVTIGTGAIVGASAVVTKSLPPYSINVGIPARTIGYRR